MKELMSAYQELYGLMKMPEKSISLLLKDRVI